MMRGKRFLIFPDDKVSQEADAIASNVEDGEALLYAYHISKALLQAATEIYGGLIVHEVGHYTVLKTVYPAEKASINIAPKAWGVNDNSYAITAPLLFSIGDLNVYGGKPLPSWSGMSGMVIDDEDLARGCQNGDEYRDKWTEKYYGKQMTLKLAGGAFQVVYYYALFFMSAMQQKFSETHDVKTSIMWSLKNAFFPFQNILDQHDLTKPELLEKLILYSARLIVLLEATSYSFLPSMEPNGDGNGAWGALLGEKTFNKIPKKYLHPIVLYSGTAFILYKAISTYKAYVEKYQLNGDQVLSAPATPV